MGDSCVNVTNCHVSIPENKAKFDNIVIENALLGKLLVQYKWTENIKYRPMSIVSFHIIVKILKQNKNIHGNIEPNCSDERAMQLSER